MSTNDDFFAAPNRKPRPPPLSEPGESLFSFDHDRAVYNVELRFLGESLGWDVQFFWAGEFLISHRFDTRGLAVAWAEGYQEVDRERLGSMKGDG